MLSLALGKQIASRSISKDDGISFGAIDGAVFSFLSLFLAFSLSAAGSRLEARREIVVTEATSIREAVLYARAIPPSLSAQISGQLREYVKIRQEYNVSLSNYVGIDAQYERTLKAQEELWRTAVRLLDQPQAHDEILRLQTALVATFRAGSDRHVAALTREPDLIYALLIAVALLAGLLAGRQLSDSRKNQMMHRIIFALVISATIYVMMDLDNPRRGLIKLEYADQLLNDIR